ncbi:hypothetical protein F5Y19DRAFT_244030 [Xylariaceae sp. FL1651]|nr:hypothetical protein F5Y19DRAFT_244030 [Xylariaceae sp. FL1651]
MNEGRTCRCRQLNLHMRSGRYYSAADRPTPTRMASLAMLVLAPVFGDSGLVARTRRCTLADAVGRERQLVFRRAAGSYFGPCNLRQPRPNSNNISANARKGNLVENPPRAFVSENAENRGGLSSIFVRLFVDYFLNENALDANGREAGYHDSASRQIYLSWVLGEACEN